MHRLAIALYPTSPQVPAPEEVDRGDEWHTLLLAVRTRLRDVLDAWPMVLATPQEQLLAEHSRAAALDCADALDQLHETLIDHGQRCRRLAFDLQEARAELARRVTEG